MIKDKDLVVAFGALGAPIHIGTDKESRLNGNTQYVSLLKSLLRNPKIKNVVIMGTFGSETEKNQSWKSIDPEGKIIYPLPMVHRIAQYVWGKDAEFSSYRAPYPDGSREMLPYKLTRPFQDLYVQYCSEQLPKIDFGLFFITQGWAGTNICGVIRKKTDPEQFRVQLPMAAEKAGPFIHALNYLKTPWFIVSPDDRVVYSMPRHDTLNMPKEIIGQWHAEYVWDTIDSYEDGVNLTNKTLTVNYGAIEELNLVDAKLVSPAAARPNKFVIVANQSTNRNDLSCQRFQQLKKWILDDPRTKDYTIYGEWDPAYLVGYEEEKTKEGHKKLIEFNKEYLDYSKLPPEKILYPQFKGRVDSSVIDSAFQQTRYTLCFPVIHGYLTWKWLEALMNGCLPFIPPFYDEQFNAIPEDAIIRVKDPEELHFKIDWFEQNPDKRIQLVQFYQEIVLKPCLDGSYIYPHINRFLERNGVDCRV